MTTITELFERWHVIVSQLTELEDTGSPDLNAARKAYIEIEDDLISSQAENLADLHRQIIVALWGTVGPASKQPEAVLLRHAADALHFPLSELDTA